jgi:thiamine biosynthesis lipoprotein
MSEVPAMPPCIHFAHDAMNTTYHLRIPEGDPKHLQTVSQICFDELDLLESQLSRFVEGSDVSRINQMQAGERLFLSDACYDCLRRALELHQETGGLFDITLGAQIEHLKSGAEGEAPPISGSLAIAPDRPLVECLEPGRQIDLGGIGKGFALDRLQQILIEWEIESALISAGASTQLAHGSIAWPVRLSGDHGSVTIGLKQAALSASGIGIQGSHIVHPDASVRPGAGLPYTRVWLIDPSATAADAWSTSIMLMTPEQIAQLGDDQPQSLYVEDAEGIRPWRTIAD